MSPDSPISEALLAELDALPGCQVQRDRELVNARQEAFRADLVVRPADPEAVGAVVRAFARAGQPWVILAGNTGLVGAGTAVPGEAVLDLGRLNRLLELRFPDGRVLELGGERDLAPEERLRAYDASLARFRADHGEPPAGLEGAVLVCEAAVAVDEVNAWLRALGLAYPMDMGSNSAATLGGCTANASAGARALRFGTGAEMAAFAEGFWADGNPARCPGRAAGPRAVDPDALRIDSSRFPLGDSLIGSQGTLGVITRVGVRLGRVALAQETALFGVDTLAAGQALIGAAEEAFAGAGRGLELAEVLGRSCVELVAEKEGVRLDFDDPATAEKPFFIMLQARADTPEAAAELQDVLLAFVEERTGEAAAHLFYDPTPGEGNLVRRVRHSITHASDARLGQLRAERTGAVGRLGFDVAVPTARADDFAGAWRERAAELAPDLETHVFGHLGVGGFHIHHLGPMDTARKRVLMDAMAACVTEHGGTFSAEHGVGTLWAPMLLGQREEGELEALARLFLARDPQSLLAPRSHGKRELRERFQN